MNDEFELIGGPERREIKLVAYDHAWPERFEEEARKIREALSGHALRIDHVGSTAIKDMPAKPIIDIQVSVNSPDDETTYLPQLERQGYQLRVREKGHRMLRTLALDVHIHVCRAGSDWERRHLLFRDWLRTNKQDHDAYARLKEELAKSEWETMNHYADAKGGLIKEITLRAERWATESGWRP